MKKTSNILLAGALAGWFATTASAQDAPAPTAAPAAAAAPAPVAPNPNAKLTAGPADEGITLNLRGATVDKVLAYLSEAAGFIINRNASTGLAATANPNTGSSTVDLVSAQPVSKDEIVVLLNQVLAEHNLTAVRNGRTLTIETLDDALNSATTPVIVNTDGTNSIPEDAEVVTEVIPVHSLNPAQVIKDLYTLIPRGAQMNSSESGNAVVMTASQSNIRRFVSLIKALDSTGTGDLEVFLLTYADSKSIAQEIKDVFTSDSGAGAAGNPFNIFGGGRGGRGGGGAAALFGGGAAPEDANKSRAAIHVNAVSDDENNAVLISAPADYMDGISNLIVKLDIPQEDSVQIRLFSLHNADCTDVANELLQLFPDPTQQNNQQNGRRGAAQFGGGGGRGGAFGGLGGGGGGGGAGASMSDRLKKQITVNAVADPRTQSILVTASKDTMTQIERIIDEMDNNPANKMKVFVYIARNGDVLDMQGPLQDLFMASGKTSSSASSQQNALQQRITQNSQQQGSLSQTQMGSTGGGSGTGR